MPFKSTDVAYLAGLYEGEGTVRVDRSFWTRQCVRRTRLTPQIKLRIGMTDREPLERLLATIGGRINGPYVAEAKHKPWWIWDLDSPPLVRVVVTAIYPLLSPRRQRQLDEALGEREAVA